MSQADKIKLEKINFLENYSKKFYTQLFRKDEENNSTIFLITNLLLKEEKLEECSEYEVLKQMTKGETNSNLEENFVCNILSTVTQFLCRVGSEDNVKVILTYFDYNNNKEFEQPKVLCLA